jgi:protein-disulfide isomerase
MLKNPVFLACLTTAVLASSAPALEAQEASKAQEVLPFTAKQETRVREIVRAYLLEHPEILIEANRALQARQAEQGAAQFAQALQETREELLNDPATPVGGNPDGAVSVVEFFDYNCPHCRRANSIVVEMLERNPDVRFVYKELPVLGELSEFAARAALAVHRQRPELYASFHQELLKADDELTEDAVVGIAREFGIDLERMRSDMQDSAIGAHLDKNVELAKALGVRGTPAFVIGKELLRGRKPLAVLQSAIEKARAIQ